MNKNEHTVRGKYVLLSQRAQLHILNSLICIFFLLTEKIVTRTVELLLSSLRTKKREDIVNVAGRNMKICKQYVKCQVYALIQSYFLSVISTVAASY